MLRRVLVTSTCMVLLSACGGQDDTAAPQPEGAQTAAAPSAPSSQAAPLTPSADPGGEPTASTTSGADTLERAVEQGVRLDRLERSGDGVVATLTNLNQLPVTVEPTVFFYNNSGDLPSASLKGAKALEPQEQAQVPLTPVEPSGARVPGCEQDCTYEFYADVVVVEEGVDAPLDRERACTEEVCRLGP